MTVLSLMIASVSSSACAGAHRSARNKQTMKTKILFRKLLISRMAFLHSGIDLKTKRFEFFDQFDFPAFRFIQRNIKSVEISGRQFKVSFFGMKNNDPAPSQLSDKNPHF